MMNGNGNRFHPVGLALMLFALAQPAATPGSAATGYFVALDGDDANDGRTRDAAFATIQRGVDALETGDTLTITPGEYLETVSRSDLGGSGADTIIRAEIPGTVTIRGDVPLGRFRKVEGYRNVYATPYANDADIQALNELDTFAQLNRAPHVAELDYTSGTFFHDTDAGRLYISSPDLSPPDERRYTVSILEDSAGIRLIRPRRVLLIGLSVTGFAGSGRSGIVLTHASRCVVRDCRAYLNGVHGIVVSHSGNPPREFEPGGNVIENCRAWGNNQGIHIYNPRGETVRDSLAFRNQTGISMYAHSRGDPVRMRDNIAWRNVRDFRGKTFGGMVHSVERCVGPGLWVEFPRHAVRNSVQGDGSQGRDFRDNIVLSGIDDLDPDAEFADPDNRDYRLQATSRFRGAGSNGGDLGLPYRGDVYFVGPRGNDAADGLSVAGAWATLSRALGALTPGDTLYVLPGRYDESLRIRTGDAAGKPIAIRGHGTAPVDLAGSVHIAGSHNVTFERLRFRGAVRVDDGAAVRFEQCAFVGASVGLQGVENAHFVHNTFSADAVALIAMRACRRILLAGNRFDNENGVAVATDRPAAILYADYNAYRSPRRAWWIDGEARALEALPAGWERYGSDGADDWDRASHAGPHGRPAGTFKLDPGHNFRLAGPFIHAVGATSANVEWFMSRDTRQRDGRNLRKHLLVEASWGETPECEHPVRLGDFSTGGMFVARVNAGPFGGFSLTGLKPNTRYYVRINAVKPFSPEGEDIQAEWNAEPISFTTAARYPETVVYHVAPDGDDGNDGRSPDRALRTLYRAGDLVCPGDTVSIAEGVYYGRIPVRATGTPERPITFAARPGARVVLDGDHCLANPIATLHKSHLRFDGLHLLNFTSGSPALRLFLGDDVRFSRILFDGRHRVWSPYFVYAAGMRDLTFSNCVGINSYSSSPRVYSCRGGFLMEHCVIIHNKIGGALIHTRDGVVRNTIFTDCQDNKITVPVFPFRSGEGLRLERNGYAMRVERELSRHGSGYPVPFADFEEYVLAFDGVVGDPRFAVLQRPDRPAAGGSVFSILSAGNLPELDFPDLFATNPEFVERGIGLDPEAFSDLSKGP